jgi:virginiamycin B lyase
VVTEYALGSPSFSPEQIVEGPDGNLWFTQTANGDIGRMTPSGGLSEFFAHFANNAGPEGITSGPDDDLWFADPNDNTIGAMTTSGRVAKLFTITQPPGTPPATLLTLTTTTEGPPRTVQRTTTTTTTIPQPSPISAGFITAGPDGNLWLAAYNGLIDSGYILRLTPTGSQTLFPTTQQPARLTVGPDCAIWFTSITEVNRIDTGVRSLPPSTGTPPGCHPATTAGR